MCHSLPEIFSQLIFTNFCGGMRIIIRDPYQFVIDTYTLSLLTAMHPDNDGCEAITNTTEKPRRRFYHPRYDGVTTVLQVHIQPHQATGGRGQHKLLPTEPDQLLKLLSLENVAFVDRGTIVRYRLPVAYVSGRRNGQTGRHLMAFVHEHRNQRRLVPDIAMG